MNQAELFEAPKRKVKGTKSADFQQEVQAALRAFEPISTGDGRAKEKMPLTVEGVGLMGPTQLNPGRVRE